jgi:hypothetical protein
MGAKAISSSMGILNQLPRAEPVPIPGEERAIVSKTESIVSLALCIVKDGKNRQVERTTRWAADLASTLNLWYDDDQGKKQP